MNERKTVPSPKIVIKRDGTDGSVSYLLRSFFPGVTHRLFASNIFSMPDDVSSLMDSSFPPNCK